MKISHIDHLVLTVADVDASCRFYQRVLGFERVEFGSGRVALAFGRQKINLHPAGRGFEPRARVPTPGSADLCVMAEGPIDAVTAHLRREGVVIERGPVPRTGATGPIVSVYFRDPDGNLLEVAEPRVAG